MPDPSAVAQGSVQAFTWLANTYAGDGDVEVSTQSISNKKWDCEKNEQVAQVCPFTDTRKKIASFISKTYAFTNSLGYISQKFEVWVEAETNGCDVLGAHVYVTNYSESLIGRTANWRVRATAHETGFKESSGCDDCCPKSAAVKLSVSVSTPGFKRSYRVRVYGNGLVTVAKR